MDIYEEITRLRKEGRRGALATIINVHRCMPSFETAKMLVREDGTIAGTIGGGCVEAEVWEAAREVMKNERPQTLNFNLNNNPKYDTGLSLRRHPGSLCGTHSPRFHALHFGAGMSPSVFIK